MTRTMFRSPRCVGCAMGAFGAIILTTSIGCNPGFNTIDHRVNDLLLDTSEGMGQGAPSPQVESYAGITTSDEVMDDKNPPTWNPSADEFLYVPTAETDAQQVLSRLDNYQEEDEHAELLGLQSSLEWAFIHSREYQFAEEEYVLACLALLIEQHRWVPRFYDTITPAIDADSDDGFYDTAFNLVNEWKVEQKLPYGGEVSARWLASFSKDLHNRVGTEDDPSDLTSEFILGASVPFLRGAGPVAQEALIQAERNVVYAARAFESFRRSFLVRITKEFLGLQVERRRLQHQQESIRLYELNSEREQALFEAGRVELSSAANAENNVLKAKSQLAQLWEQYRLNVDQFKRLIGYPIDKPARISEDAIALAVPTVDMDSAVQLTLANRLDLQTERDRLIDRQRAIRNAENALLPDLNLNLEAGIPSAGSTGWDGLDPDFRGVNYSAGLSFGLPLDREIERLAVRTAQINLERLQRAFILFRDTLVIDVRAAVRDIDANLFSLDLERRNVVIAQLAVDQIEADPDRVGLLETQNAIEQLQQAQDGRDSAFRDVQVSILRYLEQSGQLRVNTDGTLQLLPGMELLPYDDLAIQGPSI